LWSYLGVAQARANESEQFVESLRKAVDLTPDRPFAHRNLGGALMKLSRFAEAKVALS
jgi:Flp pilus assembly protein TadD